MRFVLNMSTTRRSGLSLFQSKSSLNTSEVPRSAHTVNREQSISLSWPIALKILFPALSGVFGFMEPVDSIDPWRLSNVDCRMLNATIRPFRRP